jgi:hypothetical protein
MAILLPLLTLLAVTQVQREFVVTVHDRLDRDVDNPSFCAGIGDGPCEPVAQDGQRTPGGVWRLRLDPAGRVIRITAKGFLPATLDDLDKEPADAPRVRNVRLKASGWVAMRFTIEGMRREESVDLFLTPILANRLASRALDTKKVALGKTGAYVRLEDIPAGTYLLAWEGPNVARGERRIEVPLDAGRDAGIVSVHPGRILEGFVVDPAGDPIEGAQITVEGGYGAGGLTIRGSSGHGGAFSLAGIQTDEPMTWNARAKGFENASGAVSDELRLTIILEHAPRVFGRVVDDQKSPVPDASVQVTYIIKEKPLETASEAESRTNKEGAFSAPLVRRSRVRLDIQASGFRPLRKMLDRSGAEASTDYDLGDLQLSRGRTATGRVFDAGSGNPIGRANVREAGVAESGNQVESAADGQYELSGLANRSVTLSVAAAGYATSSRGFGLGADHLDFPLQRGGTIEGGVCAAGEELAETIVTVSPAERDGDPRTARPDSRGTFIVEALEPGTYRVYRGYRVEVVPGNYTVVVPAGDATMASVQDGATAKVTLGCDGLPVTGTILVNGTPLGNAYGSLVGTGVLGTLLRTDATGTFAVRVPAPGQYRATFMLPAGIAPERTRLSDAFCVVPPGGTTSCVLNYSLIPAK